MPVKEKTESKSGSQVIATKKTEKIIMASTIKSDGKRGRADVSVVTKKAELKVKPKVRKSVADNSLDLREDFWKLLWVSHL